jgi:hypothetical protein
VTVRVYRVHPAEFPPHQRPVRHPRALSPGDQEELIERYDAGWSIDALMRCYGISRRTVYRYVAGEVVVVRIGGWEAAFQVNPREGRGEHPVRIGHWQRVEAA